MKKKLQYSAVLKFIALVICVFSTIGAIASVVFMVVESNIPGKKELQERLYNDAARNYALEAICSSKDSADGKISESVAADLKGAGVEYELYKSHSKYKEKPGVDNPGIVDYNSIIEESDYTYSVLANYYPDYDTNNIWGAMRTGAYFESSVDDGFEIINTIIYSKNDKLFYINTDSGKFYVVLAVDICENGTLKRYEYDESEDSYICLETKEGILTDPSTWDYAVLYDKNNSKITCVDWSSERAMNTNYVNAINYDVVEGIGRGDCSYSGFTFSDEGDSVKSYVKNDENMYYYTIFIGLNGDTATDSNNLFAQIDDLVYLIYELSDYAMLVELICALLFLFSAIYLVYACGKSTVDGQIRITWFDRIPFIITFSIVATLCAMAAEGMVAVSQVISNYELMACVELQIAAAVLLVCYYFLGSIITKLKGKCFWRYTLLYLLLRPFSYIGKLAKENLSLFVRMIIITTGLFILYLVSGIFAFFAFGSDEIAMLWLLASGIVLVAMFFFAAQQFSVLSDAGKRIAGGELDNLVELNKLVWIFKDHGENINSIGESIESAVSDKLKSERFKTELITNVSHDIKTPLTSIINYVDLIKKGDYSAEDFVEYVDVLDRQSNRLKKLIEDLMEASKASSGSLEVMPEKFDATIMLTQVAGEFESRMLENNLALVMNIPEPPVELIADGRHLWRVFDNLLSNICKYALAGTRVYIDMKADDSEIYMTFKNTSSQQLNISADELMERFVRGDSSRNTEGNGLGLSIATSLVTLMKGQMQLDIDGDLFKVTLIFDRAPMQNTQIEQAVN